MPSKTEAISNFLEISKTPLAYLYNEQMEVQVIVAKDQNEVVKGEYKGRKWQAYKDQEGNIYKPFRIPWRANTENPHFDDSEMSWDLAKHADAIGMTGWNWVRQETQWVAFDFDSLVNHNIGLTDKELEEILAKAMTLDYVTIRRSTSGSGYHFYVFLDNFETKTHTEHAALARAIMGKMCADVGYDFQSSVDVMGGIMWCWARKFIGTNGFQLIKQGNQLSDIPINWRDHLDVVSKKKRKVNINVPNTEKDEFQRLLIQRQATKLDSIHSELINYLNQMGVYAQWNNDHNLLITHTSALAHAHRELNLRGIFLTTAQGKEEFDKNCFCFPLEDGAWSVRRFTKGILEEISWDQDGSGWTRCYFNRDPDFPLACKINSGIEDSDGSYSFDSAQDAIDAASSIGVHFQLEKEFQNRAAKLIKQKGTNRLIIQLDHRETDPGKMGGWINKKKLWQKIGGVANSPITEPEYTQMDETFRHCIDDNHRDAGWFLLGPTGSWQEEPLTHVKYAMTAQGYTTAISSIEIGTLIQNSWKLVNRPFQSEYPGDRVWNHQAAQLKYSPKESTEDLKYPTWNLVLKHIGKNIDQEVANHPWCQEHFIFDGASYLKCWIACLLQDPIEPLPYLFLFGEQNSGKSTLHEAISLLINRGVMRADGALTNSSAFNGELRGIVLAIIEETNLGGNKNAAYNRIKDWVTAREMAIHIKQKTPYMSTNSLHFIQAANDISFCPSFPGDTRITMIHVDCPKHNIPRKELFKKLEDEAQDFLTEVINLELPPPQDRLRVPVINTKEKIEASEANIADLSDFLETEVYECQGNLVLGKELWERFFAWLDPKAQTYWSRRRFFKEMNKHVMKGRSKKDNYYYFVNISLVPKEPLDIKYVLDGEYLKYEG